MTGLNLSQIAEMVGGDLNGDSQKMILGAGPFDQADETQITFAEGAKMLARLNQCRAGAVLIGQPVNDTSRNVIQVKNPRFAFARVLSVLYPQRHPAPGIHKSAVIGSGCRLGDQVALSAGVVLGNRVRLGRNVILYPNTVIGDGVIIGDDTIVYPNVSILSGCRVGNRVIIHAGSVIGSDGFGFVPQDGKYHKIPQVGIVQIDDDVEIGANNTIDRATFGRTWVKTGVKTDNMVHIAHNVEVGEHTVLVAQVGISGSTRIGHHAVLAGQAGISGHLTIGNNATIGPQAGVAQSVEDGQVVSGTSAMPHQTWLRLQRIKPKLPDLVKKVRRLEKQMARLESGDQSNADR